MLKPIYILLTTLFFTISINAQIKTGLSLSVQSCSACVNKNHSINAVRYVCGDDEVKQVKFGFLPRIKTDYFGIALSYYAKADALNLYDNLVIGGGLSIGYSNNYFKRVNYINVPFGLLLQQNYLDIHYLTNDAFLYLKLMTWIYLEAGVHDRLLLFRQYPKGYAKFKGNEWEKEYNIPGFYSKAYISLGIEIKGIVLKYRYINFNKNIIVEYLYESDFIKERDPIVTKFKGMSELILSIPIKTYQSKKIKTIEF